MSSQSFSNDNEAIEAPDSKEWNQHVGFKRISVHQNEAKHEGNVLKRVVIWILFASLFERFGYFFGNSSQTLYTRSLGLSPVVANNLQSTFQATVYIVPIVAMMLADTKLGRWVILPIASIGVAIAMTGIALAEYFNVLPLIYICYFGLFALFDSPLKPGMMVLAADQFDLSKEAHVKQKGHMFQLYYWFTNVAAMVATLVGPMVVQNGTALIPLEFGFNFTFIVAAASFLISSVILLSTQKMYWVKGGNGSALIDFLSLSWHRSKTSLVGKALIAGVILMLVAVVLSIPNFFLPDNIKEIINYVLAFMVLMCMFILLVWGDDVSWLVYKRYEDDGTSSDSTCGGKHKGCKKTIKSEGGKSICCQYYNEQDYDDARAIWRLVPYIALAFPFWAVYNQMNTNFVNQACQLNAFLEPDFGADTAVFAAPSMSSLNCAVIVLMIPILDFGLFPSLSKWFGIKDTLLRRMGIGLIAATLGVFSAAVLEYFRLESPPMVVPCGAAEIDAGWCDPATDDINLAGWLYQEGVNDMQTVIRDHHNALTSGMFLPIPKGSTSTNPLAYVLSKCYSKPANGIFATFSPVSEIRIWWSILPHALVGLGEVCFAAVATDFFYSQVPADVRSVMQGLNMLTVSLGTLVGAIIDVIFAKDISTDLNQGAIWKPFVTMGSLGVAACVVFIIKASRFEYRDETVVNSIKLLDSDSEANVISSRSQSEKLNPSERSKELSDYEISGESSDSSSM